MKILGTTFHHVCQTLCISAISFCPVKSDKSYRFSEFYIIMLWATPFDHWIPSEIYFFSWCWLWKNKKFFPHQWTSNFTQKNVWCSNAPVHSSFIAFWNSLKIQTVNQKLFGLPILSLARFFSFMTKKVTLKFFCTKIQCIC